MSLSGYTRLTPGPDNLRSTFAGYPSGVAAIAAHMDGMSEVIVASSFTVGVSLEPPLVLFAAQNTSRTWARLREAPVLGVSVLGADQEPICRQLASAPAEQRFAGIESHHASSDALFVEGAPVWLECTLWKEVEAGDHSVAMLEIQGLFRDVQVEPLVFHGSRFRRLEPLAG